jgi:hypothetical protein
VVETWRFARRLKRRERSKPVAGTDHNRFGRIVVKIILRPDILRRPPEKSKT